MKIIIDIDDNLYTRLFDNGDIDAVDMLKAYAAIRKGTVLPKNHGRLIDADELEECKDIMKPLVGAYRYAVRMDDIRDALTIIAAESEEEE